MGDDASSRSDAGLRSGSRFGSAIALAGDLNRDGYNDIVIGAPMHDGGKGAVYIFHGSKDGVVPQYKQVTEVLKFLHLKTYSMCQW